MQKLLRPYGIVLNGCLELGLELLVELDDEGAIVRDIRPHTGIPEVFILSTAFVNAHSHLEYRGLQGKLAASDYWSWIREITEAKRTQDFDTVRRDAALAARENRATGVAAIAEHSDRPVAAEAIRDAHLSGVIFQELITRFEKDGGGGRTERTRLDCGRQAQISGLPTFVAPHAFQTVDEQSLSEIAESGRPFSMHVAESDIENELTLFGSGPIAATFERFGVPFVPTGSRLIPTLDKLGILRQGAQFVHCCAISEAEVVSLSERGVTVAHCPRSNTVLGCPPAPVREMLDAGIAVGLGLDSAASSGAIDMFAEMREAVRVGESRGRAVSPEEVWAMATTMGAESIRAAARSLPVWDFRVGERLPPAILIDVDEAYTTDDLIERGTPTSVSWLELPKPTANVSD